MTTAAQPGWYADPEDANSQRYWDGQAWTPHRNPEPLSGQPPEPHLPPPNQQAPWPPSGQQPSGSPPQKSKKASMFVISLLVACAVLFPASVIIAKMAPVNDNGVIRHPWDMLSGGGFIIAVLILTVAIVIVVVRLVKAKRQS
jgi:hypothetical protein